MPSLLLSNGGAHSPHIACMAGNVTPYKEVREGRGKERGGEEEKVRGKRGRGKERGGRERGGEREGGERGEGEVHA